MNRIIIIISAFFVSLLSSAQNYLFKDSKTDYTISISDNGTPIEKKAAQELQYYLYEISGTKFPISSSKKTKVILIKDNELSQNKTHENNSESFAYKTIDDNLLIEGDGRCVLYGVYTFLEKELGVHWLSKDYTYIQHTNAYILPNLYEHQTAHFQYRLNYCFTTIKDHSWTAHNLLNTLDKTVNNEYGGLSAYWGIHTFSKLLPPERYFKEHPEFYSLINGRRTENAQLCLSNKNMFQELVKNLKDIIKANPGYWCYDVSQNDNSFPCECNKCNRLVQKYGNQSGALIWFVNQVANEIKKDYPNIYIGTFAYRYTRKAPTSGIQPAANVVIRLCDIECCMAHPLQECTQNKDFIDDLTRWRDKTSNIFIWDYATGFNNYLLPFPNLHSLSANYKVFAKYNTIGIMEEGPYDSPWGEFSELKQWVVSKLMWNPNQNADSLANIFINCYYEEASEYIKAYHDLCYSIVATDTHFTIKNDWTNSMYSTNFIEKSSNILSKAVKASQNNPIVKKRVMRIVAQLYYLKIRKNPSASLADGTVDAFTNIIKNDNALIKEHKYTLEKFIGDINKRNSSLF